MRFLRFLLICSASLLALSCFRQDPQAVSSSSFVVSFESEPPAEPAVPEAAAPRPEAWIVALGGAPSARSGNAVRTLAIGSTLLPGDLVETDETSWAEFVVGSAEDVEATSFVAARLSSSSRFALIVLSGGAGEAGPRAVEFGLESGSIVVKAGKQSGRDELLVVTPNAAARVRGTSFLAEAEPGRSRFAVASGAVAVLAKGPLFSNLLDGRAANPVAGAVVRAAFAFAPVARSGEAISVGGSIDASEAAYGELLAAAERTQANGFALESIDDPSGFLVAAGSDQETRLRAALAVHRPEALSPEAYRSLLKINELRNPALAYESHPVSLPVERAARDRQPPKPAAVLWSARASAAPLVASLTRSGDLVVALDGRGAVHAVDPDGRIAWSLPGDALAATAFDRFVAVASAEGLSVRDGVDGSERGRFSYGFAPSAPSAKPVAVPEGLAVATPRGIALLRSENAVLVREIPVDGGVVSAPTLAGRELACVSGDGSLVLIDLGAGIVSAKIPVGLGSGPFPPRGRGDFLVVGDRGGRLAGVSASARAVLWTRDLGTRLGIEPEIGEGRLFAWTADKKLLTLSTEDGSELAPPVVDVLSPPLLSDGRLYWGGKAGVLVVADAANMREVKRIPIAEGVTVRPIIVGGTLYAGTGGGRIVKVDISR